MESEMDGKQDGKQDSQMDTIVPKVIQLCGGNPGAITVLGNIYAANQEKSKTIFNKLIELDFKGVDIWKLYVDSGKKINVFADTILELKELPTSKS